MLRRLRQKLENQLYFFSRIHKLFFPVTAEKTFIVLAMGRSGTSVVSNLLVALDVDMGSNLLGKTEHNKKGHFENLFIQKINKDILREVGASWDKPPSDEEVESVKEKFSTRIKRSIKLEKSKVWGWKDPRTVFTLPLFIGEVENPLFVVCRRNPEDVARSLNYRDGTSVEHGLEVAGKYNKKLQSILSEHTAPRIEIVYEDLLENPIENVKRLAGFVGKNISDEELLRIAKIVDPSVSTINS